jgi:streptogramin lyase
LRRSSCIRLAAILIATAILSGCGITLIPASQTSSPVTTPTPQQGVTATTASVPIAGKVHGALLPVAGARIYLFAASTTGYGTQSTSLLDPSQPGVFYDTGGAYVLTDATGAFNITGDYVCATGQQLFVVAIGGNPGLPNGQTNPNLVMMSLLGACPAGQTSFASTLSSISINEVTTVASVYALSGFMTDVTHIGSSGTPAALQGIANAFLTFNNLADLASGTALTQNDQGNGEVPQAEINALANLLVPCMNSTGSGADCASLFSNAQDAGRGLPSNPVIALLNIAQNPSANVSTLFNLGNVNPFYLPTLPAAPHDWTLAITFYSDTMIAPYFPAIDSKGNIWVPAYASNTLTEFDPNGNLISGGYGFGGGGLNLPYSIAIDANDNPWVLNFGPINASSVSKFLSNGSAAVSTPYPCGIACFFMAFDASQNLWISGSNNTTVLSTSGTVLKQFSTTAYDSGIAIDSTGSAWTIGQSRTIDHLTLPSVLSTIPEAVTSTTGNELTSLAIDSAGDVWFASSDNNAIGKTDKSGTILSPSGGYTGGGLNGPAQLAIDGVNRVWVVNRGSNTLSAFNNTGVPITSSTGYQASGLNGPRGLAIDGSGNIWITNFTYNSITEFVGLAAPVVTPTSPTTHGQRP